MRRVNKILALAYAFNTTPCFTHFLSFSFGIADSVSGFPNLAKLTSILKMNFKITLFGSFNVQKIPDSYSTNKSGPNFVFVGMSTVSKILD